MKTIIKVEVLGDNCRVVGIDNVLSSDEVEGVLGKMKASVYFYEKDGPWYYLDRNNIRYFRPDTKDYGSLGVNQVYAIDEFEKIFNLFCIAGKRFSDLRRLGLEVKSYYI